MSNSKFLKFFDKYGNDMNLSSVASDYASLDASGTTFSFYGYTGSLFFPRVSVNLIESQQVFLLQEITGPTSSYILRKIHGEITTTGGSPIISGDDTDFTSLTAGQVIKISTSDYTISSISGATSMTLTSSVSTTQVTENIYLYDYSSLNELRSSPGATSEYLKFRFETETEDFFFYDIDYTEDVPFIERSNSLQIQLTNGISDSIDSKTGRISLSSVNPLPSQVNIGFSSVTESIFENTLIVELEKNYECPVSATPSFSDTYTTIIISGTASQQNIFEFSEFTLKGFTSSGATVSYYSKNITLNSVGTTGSNTELIFSGTDFNGTIGASNYSHFRVCWTNAETVAAIDVYGETVEEDERLKVLLENFGKKLDFDKEYIFRESDIYEELPDYTLLNNKRKELLLEGDNIYPYIGSYKALVNIINFFGYYDVNIKEYFLNVDKSSRNYGKYLHLQIPRNSTQRTMLRKAWEIVPSNVYKKTSLFGLFYDINKATDTYDSYGIPDVEDSFDFSPEEVLVKLFGLKELLKKDFLPLNARIYDITGEGIYFERIRIDTWADNLQYITLNIGSVPSMEIYPKTKTYISDIRRIDDFYVSKFEAQGLKGFLGTTASTSDITVLGYTSSLTLTDYLGSYDNYNTETEVESLYNADYEYFPPGISYPSFNQIAARLTTLPDDESVVTAAPILLEATFEISWEESTFSWSELGILGPTGAPVNVNLWSWETLGQGEYIEMQWTVQKSGHDGFFYDSGRKSIGDFRVDYGATGGTVSRVLHAVALPYVGNYDIALYLYDVTNNTGVNFYRNYEVSSKNVDFVSFYSKETSERTWKEFENDSITWEETAGPWYYPLHIEAPWEDFKISWEAMESSDCDISSLVNENVQLTILSVDPVSESIIFQGDLTNYITSGEYLLLKNEKSELNFKNLEIPQNTYGTYLYGTTGATFQAVSMSGSTGSSTIYTDIDTTSYLSSGDYLFASSNWYTVSSVNSSTITIEETLNNSFIGATGFSYDDTLTLTVASGSSFTQYGTSSLSILTTNLSYDAIIPDVDFYAYVSATAGSSSLTIVESSHDSLRYNVSLNFNIMGGGNEFYLSGGISTGDYSILISSVSLTGNNTIVKFDDIRKHLYYIDNNFTSYITSYDTEYAQKRLGSSSLEYDNMNETSWEEMETKSWYNFESDETVSCGFILPFVSPSGTIQVDENTIFSFSGNASIRNTRTGMEQAALELNNSSKFYIDDQNYLTINEGIGKFDYEALPRTDFYLLSATATNVYVSSYAATGATGMTFSVSPVNLRIPASMTASISGGVVTALNFISRGFGYNAVPTITIGFPDSGGSLATASATITSDGQLNVISLTGGSGYTTVPEVTVSYPNNYKLDDEYLWTGSEWIKAKGASATRVTLNSALNYGVTASSYPFLPYEHHKQIFRNTDIFRQYYYFVRATAKNSSAENLSYILLGSGNESEWINHPDRTSSYPLKNYMLNPESNELLNKWLYEGSSGEISEYQETSDLIQGDYPGNNVYSDYDSDILSNEYRLPFVSVLQSRNSYINSIVSDSQIQIELCTFVTFSYDNCKIPGKKNPRWTLKNEDDGIIQAVSNSKIFSWNFTRAGNFSLLLELEDSNGNKSSMEKKSFIVTS